MQQLQPFAWAAIDLSLLLLQELAKGPKLVLRADDEAQLMAVADAARAQGLPCHSIAEPTGMSSITSSSVCGQQQSVSSESSSSRNSSKSSSIVSGQQESLYNF
jgi:hypothetical protein